MVIWIKISNTESARVGCTWMCAGGGSALPAGPVHLVHPTEISSLLQVFLLLFLRAAGP